MRPAGLFLALILVLLMMVWMTACGGTAASTPTAPSSAPTTAPPSGGGNSTTANQLQEAIQGPAGSGTLTVNATGDVSIQVSGMERGAVFSWRFCAVTTAADCFDLGQKLLIDANGNGQLTFHFPKPGTWSGYFVGDSAPPGTRGAYGITTYDAAHGTMMANVQSINGVNGDTTCSTCKPLTSGTVSVSNGVAHIVLNGASPSTTYDVTLAGAGNSTSYEQGNITTDANGNVSADLPVKTQQGSIFGFSSARGGYVTGFKVP